MKISRRNFLKGAAIATGSYCIWHPVFPQGGSLDDFIQSQMERNHIPGLGACIIKELDLTRHALPYTYIPSGKSRQVLLEGGMTLKKSEEGGYYPNCLYSFYNYPDGLIRTVFFNWRVF